MPKLGLKQVSDGAKIRAQVESAFEDLLIHYQEHMQSIEDLRDEAKVRIQRERDSAIQAVRATLWFRRAIEDARDKLPELFNT